MANNSLRCTYGKRSFRKQLQSVLWDDLFNIMCNAITIKNKPEDVPERWIKNLIFRNGEFAVWKDMILEISGNNGLYSYGEPSALILLAPNRESTWTVARKDLAWIGANQLRRGVTGYLDLQVNKLAELEISLLQNIQASRVADILGVSDKDVQLSILHAVQQTENGEPVIYLDKNLLDNGLAQYKLNADFVADKINQLMQEIRNETLAHYGILNASSNKRERVQVGEIEATSDYAYDCIYTIIDTLNRDCEEQGIAMRFEFNGALDDFTPNRDLADNTDTETEETEHESEVENDGN